jgi:hypothetical protein
MLQLLLSLKLLQRLITRYLFMVNLVLEKPTYYTLLAHMPKSLYRNVRVRYVSSEEFTNDFINSIRDDKATSIPKTLSRSRYFAC